VLRAKNSEQAAYLQSGRIVVKVDLTVAVDTDDVGQAEALTEELLKALHKADINELMRLREKVFPAWWTLSTDYETE
jgi:hypothetical protein